MLNRIFYKKLKPVIGIFVVVVIGLLVVISCRKISAIILEIRFIFKQVF